MYSKYDNVKPEGDYKFLSADDKIEATDYVRCLRYSDYSGYKDYVDYDSINKMNWMFASDYCSRWVGKTVQEFNVQMYEYNTHEFIRML